MVLSPHQQLVAKDLLNDLNLLLTRLISLADFCTRLQDGIEEMELGGAPLNAALLQEWTDLEIIASLGAEHDKRKEVIAGVERVRALLQNALGESD